MPKREEPNNREGGEYASKTPRGPNKIGKTKVGQSNIEGVNGGIACEIKKEEIKEQSASEDGSNKNHVATANRGNKMCSFKSMESSLKSVKEHCELLEKFADQSRCSLDVDTQKNTKCFQDLLKLVETYYHGLCQLLQERCYFFLMYGEYSQACIYAQQIVNLAEKIPCDQGLLKEAQSILSKKFIETTYKQAGGVSLQKKHMDALVESEKFLEKVQSRSQVIVEHELLCSLYATHIQLFHIQNNLDILLECSRMARKLEDEEMLLDALCNYTHLYQLLGKYKESYDILKQMLPWRIDCTRKQCRVIVNLSVVALLLGKKDESLEYAERSVDVAKATGNESYTARYTACCYGNIGLALEKKKKFRAAIDPYLKCLELGEKADDKRVINNSYCNLGRAYEGLGEIEEAKKYYKKAAETPGPPETHWCDTEDFRFSGDFLFAMIAIKEKNWPEAHKYLKQVIARCEWLRKSCQHSRLKITFNHTQRKPFQYLQYVLLQEGAPVDALVVAEKGRGRDFYDKVDREEAFQEHLDTPEALLDIIKKRKVAVLFLSTIEVVTPNQLCMWFILPDGTCITKQISTEDADWQGILTGLCVALHMQQEGYQIESRGVENQGDDEQDQIDASIQHTLEVVKRVKGISIKDAPAKPYSPQADSQPNSCHTTSRQKSRKGDPSWPASTGTESQSAPKKGSPATLPPGSESISTASESGKKGKAQQLSESIDKLTELIIKPFESELAKLIEGSKPGEKPQLLIIPQGTTFNIPFAALCLDGKPLCSYFTLIEAFSINSFSFSTIKSEEPSEEVDCSDALIVGNPGKDLSDAEKEANYIAKILGVLPLIRESATRRQVIDRLPHARFIHFACHGEKDGKSLLLARTGKMRNRETRLTVKDVERMKIRAEMVVLSACHTARGQINSEGVLGLTRAFLVAGAKCVVTALWAIPDGATERFMGKFYENLSHDVPAADALGMAMVQMQNTEGYGDVVNWGSFKIYGANPKVSILNRMTKICSG